MKTIIRWLPIWLVGSICVTVGFMNGLHFENAPPPESRQEEWQRYGAQVEWYAMGVVVFWCQFFVWAFVNPTKSRWWFVGLALAFLLSGMLFVIGADSLITDGMIP